MSRGELVHRVSVLLTLMFQIIALAIPYWTIADVFRNDGQGVDQGTLHVGLWRTCSEGVKVSAAVAKKWKAISQ